MITPEEGAYAFETLVRHYMVKIPILGAPWLAATSDAARGKCFQIQSQRSGLGKFRMELLSLPKMNGRPATASAGRAGQCDPVSHDD